MSNNNANAAATARPTLRFLDRQLSRVEDILMFMAAIAMGVTAVTLVVDVGLRYSLNSPLRWTYDFIANYLMAAAFFFAIGQTLRKREHISIDIFARVAPPRLVHAAMAIGMLIAFVFFVGMGTQGVIATYKSFVNDENLIGGIPWPVWLSKLFWPIGIGVFSLRILFNLVIHGFHAAGLQMPAFESTGLEPHTLEDEL